MEQNIRLAQSLHPRLLAFFKRFPPPQLYATSPTTAPSEPSSISIAPTTSPADPNQSENSELPATTPQPEWPSNLSSAKKHNPFLPFRNPRTGHWHPPHYSLRRQSELYRLASSHNVLSLMPPSPKHPEFKEEKRLERALQAHQRMSEGLLPISGKKAKGKLWERTLRGRMEERRKAMEGMPEMVRLWKQRGHGRGWRKWPR